MGDVQAQTEYIRLSIDTALKSQQRWMKRNRARALLLQTGTVAASGAITVLFGLRGVAPRFETTLANAALVCGIAITVTQAWEAFFSDRDMWISRARCLHEIGSLRSNFEYVIAKHGSPRQSHGTFGISVDSSQPRAHRGRDARQAQAESSTSVSERASEPTTQSERASEPTAPSKPS